MRNRNEDKQFQQHRKRIEKRARCSDAMEFFNLLTGPELLNATESLLPDHRERLYPPTVTLSMFIGQALNEDRSCQKAVNGWAARRAAEGLHAASVDTGGYCKARLRLPLGMVVGLSREVGRLLSRSALPGWRWHGRAVKLVDGTGISMPDTAENQTRYPQPSTQAPGVGFPQARMVGVICLATGAVLDAAVGPFAGKGTGELGLFRQLHEAFEAKDVMLADACYCSYFVIASLVARGVDVVFEQNGGRNTDFRRGSKLGARDHQVSWCKPRRPDWMSVEQYKAFADEITVREVDVGGRILVTTLLEPKRVNKNSLAQLYLQRWHVELDLRHIKTTLGMDVLSCNTPDMVEKELWVYLLAYNVIRLLMAQGASTAGIHPREISFKHTAQLWTEWTARPSLNAEDHRQVLFQHIARLKVGNRPGRIEPRARKRRPKPYPWLKVPRAEAREGLRA